MKYYLYRHIRLDKDEPFYIGIGTNDLKMKYLRAGSKYNRSDYWRRITNKTSYDVEILYESSDYEFIKEKEIEFIKLYGRKNLNLGPLCNLTDGGDGTIGFIVSEETKEKLKINRKNRKVIFSVNVYQYDLKGNFIKKWNSISEASKSINVGKSYLSRLIKLNNNGNFCRGYFWKDTYSKKILPKTYREDKRTNILMLNPITEEIIIKFDSAADAFRYLNKVRSGIIRKAINNNSIVYDHKWKEVYFE